MKRFYIITFIILMAFSVPSSGHGEFILIDHGRSVSVWASPNTDEDFFFLLDPYIISIDQTGTSGDYASASQESYFTYTYRTSIKIAAKGSTYIEGDNNPDAQSWVRVDFFVNAASMECHLNYELTGGGTIALSRDTSDPDLWNLKTFSGTNKEMVPLDPGFNYRLMVNSYDIGTFNTCVSVLPEDSDGEEDSDRDCISDDQDNCPTTSNNNQTDSDNDTVGDACDMCPNTPADQLVDANGCTASQLDSDGDSVPDSTDNCPTTPNNNQADSDNDTVGDACDICPSYNDTLDADNDEIADCIDYGDADGDGFTDAEEVICGSDPADSNSRCSRGMPWLFLLLND